MKAVFLFVLMSVSSFALAQQVECPRCLIMDKLADSLQENEAKSVTRAVDYMSRFQLSTNANRRRAEVASYVRMGYLAMKRDEMGTAGEYFFGTYEEAKKEFNAVINQLPADQKHYLRYQLREIAKLFKNGNG